jgi:hypothetical protein
VKITYLELYNEELTDLLAETTSEQPEKIKIYEDKDKVRLFRLEISVSVGKHRQTRSLVRLKRHAKRHSRRSKC